MLPTNKARYQLGQRLQEADFLSQREKDILALRLGLNENRLPCTLQEIGNQYNISRERVRQIGSAIIRKIKKYLSEEKPIASRLFDKAWESKYQIKEREGIKKKLNIKRNKSIIKNKCDKLTQMVNDFASGRQGKEDIKELFKELRIRYRKNKSLFDPEVLSQVKMIRQKYAEIRKAGVGTK